MRESNLFVRAVPSLSILSKQFSIANLIEVYEVHIKFMID